VRSITPAPGTSLRRFSRPALDGPSLMVRDRKTSPRLENHPGFEGTLITFRHGLSANSMIAPNEVDEK
jgi:hypothetical protein